MNNNAKVTRRVVNSLPVLALALASALCLDIRPSEALSLVPIAQDFQPSGRQSVQTFRLENESDQQVAVIVKAATREMSIDGKETNRDTRDFLVFPENVLIGPKQSQVVRVQWRGSSTPDKELAYRIIAEQLPLRRSLAPNARAIQIVVRYVGSLYVVPSGVRPDVVVESTRAVTDPKQKRVLELVLHNKGRSHTLLDGPVLTVTAGGSSRTLKANQLKELEGQNILADSRRRFLIPWPQELPFVNPTVEFKYAPLR